MYGVPADAAIEMDWPRGDSRPGADATGTATAPPAGRIFISYRRNDADADANALYQTLRAEFGAEALFQDVTDIPVGEDFRRAIDAAMGQAVALLLVIGPGWMAQDEHGRPPVASPGDPVRLEIANARARCRSWPSACAARRCPRRTSSPTSSATGPPYVDAWEVQDHSWDRDLVPVIDRLRRMIARGAG